MTSTGGSQQNLAYDLKLTAVPRGVAIAHALEEASKCEGNHHWCAALAMLRRAVDIWSKIQRDSHKLTFEGKGEKDNLYWRLSKLADQNPMFRDAIHKVIDALRIDGNEVMHDAVICDDLGMQGTLGLNAFNDRRAAFRNLLNLVAGLVRSTLPTT